MNLICLILAALCFLIGACRAFATPRTPPTITSRIGWTDLGFYFVVLAFLVAHRLL